MPRMARFIHVLATTWRLGSRARDAIHHDLLADMDRPNSVTKSLKALETVYWGKTGNRVK
jgi:hypothetical protein